MNICSDMQAHSGGVIESRLRAKWAELLGVNTEEIGAQSDFFGLGGNSMLLLSLHIFVSQEFAAGLSIAELVKNAVFGHMVDLIESGTARVA